MEFAVLVVPYELGRLRQGVGRGPEHLLESGAEDALASHGGKVSVEVVEIAPRFSATGLGEGDAGFEVIRSVAERTRAARARGAFPVMLGGSCFAAVGLVAGLDEPSPGVVWFDAHSDFSEPVTSTSGYLDSMGLAILTGSAWQGMLAEVPGGRPVPEAAVVLAGARDFDPSERVRLLASEIRHVQTPELGLPEILLSRVDPEISGLHVHIDLDVLDADAAGVNIYSSRGGPDGEQLVGLLAALMQTFPVCGVSLTAYDPDYDTDGRLPPIALRLLQTIAEHAA
jgi:arginase